MIGGVVLSLFPGISLFDRGFEHAGICVVRGRICCGAVTFANFTRRRGRFGESSAVRPVRIFQRFGGPRRRVKVGR